MKTRNYLGKQDENRGIFAFFIVFSFVLIILLAVAALNGFWKASDNKGITSIDKFATELEKVYASITKFEVQESKLTLSGKVTENLNENVLSKLQDVKIVLKDSTGDKYEYNVDYYVSTKAIEFSTIDEKSKVSTIDLANIESGEYYVLLKITYRSNNTESGYRERFYSLKNTTDINEIKWNELSVSFKEATRVSNYLLITDKAE